MVDEQHVQNFKEMLKNKNTQQAAKNIEQYASSPYNQRNRILSAYNKP